MRDRIAAFLTDIDRALAPVASGEVLQVYHIGRSALLWEYGGGASTADVDILQPRGGERLVELAL